MDVLSARNKLMEMPTGISYVTLNANMGGKPNHFADLFIMSMERNGCFSIALLKDVAGNAEKEAWLKDKKNLTGYLEIEITYLDDSIERRMQKFTVNMVNKQTGFYKATTSLEEASGDVITANIQVAQTGKSLPRETICPGAVYAEMDIDLGESGICLLQYPDEKTVKLTIPKDTKPGSYMGTLYFVSWDSAYMSQAEILFNSSKAAGKYKDWVKKYGIAVPITITIPEK